MTVGVTAIAADYVVVRLRDVVGKRRTRVPRISVDEDHDAIAGAGLDLAVRRSD